MYWELITPSVSYLAFHLNQTQISQQVADNDQLLVKDTISVSSAVKRDIWIQGITCKKDMTISYQSMFMRNASIRKFSLASKRKSKVIQE